MKNAILALAILAPTLAFANPARSSVKEEISQIEAKTQKCLDTPENYSTYGMNECIHQGFESADKVLNRVYRGIVKQLREASEDADTNAYNQEILTRLIKSERAWVAFRDADASLNGIEMLGGSGESQVVLGTLYSMTKARAIAIDELINGEM